MPQMGVSVAEGTIVEWTKRPGDWIKRDETVALVTTDKIDVEIPSPAAGRLSRILVEAGDTVAVGTPLAELDSAARPGEAHPEENGAASEPAPSNQPQRAGTGDDGETDRSGFHSPIVKRMADEHGIDLTHVEGTGIGGRIRKRDLIALIESGELKSGPEHLPTAGRPMHIESPYRPERVMPAERREPMSPMRKQIAAHMVESRHTAAHCTTVVEVDLSRVVAARRALREPMEQRGVPLTYLAFVAAATVQTLGRHPI